MVRPRHGVRVLKARARAPLLTVEAAGWAWLHSVPVMDGKLGGMEFDFSLSDPHNLRLGRCRVSRFHARSVCFHVAGSDRAWQKIQKEENPFMLPSLRRATCGDVGGTVTLTGCKIIMPPVPPSNPLLASHHRIEAHPARSCWLCSR